jgi:serine protease AprX
MVGSQDQNSYLATIDPASMENVDGGNAVLFTMSGTSQAAAVATGVVALMLQSDPTLTPDAVKCRLMAASRPAVTSTGALAYTVFQQGAGLINAVAAVNSAATGCANVGLDINADLAGTAHFGGPANRDASGNYYLMDFNGSTAKAALSGDGFSWSGAYAMGQGYAWSQGYMWSKGFVWSQSHMWSQSNMWSKGMAWSNGYMWSKSVPWWTTSGSSPLSTKPASTVNWIPNQ